MLRGGPPEPAPTTSTDAAADSPSGLASRSVSSSPPGNRKSSPHSDSATARRPAGQSVGSAGGAAGLADGRTGAAAIGSMSGAARPNIVRTVCSTTGTSAARTMRLQRLRKV